MAKICKFQKTVLLPHQEWNPELDFSNFHMQLKLNFPNRVIVCLIKNEVHDSLIQHTKSNENIPTL